MSKLYIEMTKLEKFWYLNVKYLWWVVRSMSHQMLLLILQFAGCCQSAHSFVSWGCSVLGPLLLYPCYHASMYVCKGVCNMGWGSKSEELMSSFYLWYINHSTITRITWYTTILKFSNFTTKYFKRLREIWIKYLNPTQLYSRRSNRIPTPFYSRFIAFNIGQATSYFRQE